MSEWQPIETAPLDGTEVLLRFEDGRQAVGEYWPAPPIEIDPDQTCQGWAICLIGAGAYDLGLMAGEVGEPTHWQHLLSPSPTDNDVRG